MWLRTAGGCHKLAYTLRGLGSLFTYLIFSVILTTFWTAETGPVRTPRRIPELTILLNESNRITRPVSPLISSSKAK